MNTCKYLLCLDNRIDVMCVNITYTKHSRYKVNTSVRTDRHWVSWSYCTKESVQRIWKPDAAITTFSVFDFSSCILIRGKSKKAKSLVSSTNVSGNRSFSLVKWIFQTIYHYNWNIIHSSGSSMYEMLSPYAMYVIYDLCEIQMFAGNQNEYW
jgi:hypothetical protein